MKILKWALIVLVVLVLLAAGYLVYLGVFSSPKPYEAEMGPFTIAYESFTGPYAKTAPVFAKVYNALKEKGITARMGLGIYYDNPAQVPAEKLRSDCGVVLEKGDQVKLKGKFKVKRLARASSVVVEFPVRSTLSYMIGPMKAYPALMKYAQEKNLKGTGTYELYDEANKKIFFVLTIGK